MLRPLTYNACDAFSLQQAAAHTEQRRLAIVPSPPPKHQESPTTLFAKLTVPAPADLATDSAPGIDAPIPAAAAAAGQVSPALVSAPLSARAALAALRQSREASRQHVRSGRITRSRRMHWSEEGSETPQEVGTRFMAHGCWRRAPHFACQRNLGVCVGHSALGPI